MTRHLLLYTIDVRSLELAEEYQQWLTAWLKAADEEIERGDVASSVCLQAGLCELLLYGDFQRDWQGVFEEYLTADTGAPLAYSETFGNRVYGFAGQWQQTPIHAIYTCLWFDRVLGQESAHISAYADLIESFIQPDGWIYNPKVSETQIRTRMKSELLMSMAMGVDILRAAGRMEKYAASCVATLAGFSVTGFLSAEHFRASALETLKAVNQIPIHLFQVIQDCQAGQGYSDFAVKNKVDDYMGTAKRSSRDVALHSPLSTVHAVHMSDYISAEERQSVYIQAQIFAQHLTHDPLDIPAFQIRDLPIPFGTDISPVEVICAAWLRQHVLGKANNA